MKVKGRSSLGIIFVSVFATALILGLAGVSTWLFLQNRQLKSDISHYADLEKRYKDLKDVSPQGVTGLNDAEKVVKQVSTLAELPQTEIPRMISIDDKAVIKDIEFFKKAEVGDYVLVYEQTKFAVLYRPSTYKIINMGPQTFSVGKQ